MTAVSSLGFAYKPYGIHFFTTVIIIPLVTLSLCFLRDHAMPVFASTSSRMFRNRKLLLLLLLLLL